MQIKQQIIRGLAMALLAGSAQAKTYLSLDVGEAKQEQVQQVLDAASANYETDYGYKGYLDLTMYKVNSFSAFSQYGTVSDAWLHFDPDDTLYKVSVTYRDAGSVYKLFSDALSQKYALINTRGSGFKRTYTYGDGDVHISLVRNTFGFGNDQTTTLIYEFQPSLRAVDQMEQRIEAAIAEQNAAKAGDL